MASPRFIVAALATAAVMTAGCFLPVVPPRGGSDTPTPTPGGATVEHADWRPCPQVPQQLVGRRAEGMTYECATIKVPRDWNKVSGSAAGTAAGGTFDIALIRVRSDQQRDRIGSLLINPGGPGGSGIDLAVYLSFGPSYGGFPAEVTQRFDIIGFDPRGVGRSTPVDCISDAELDATFSADPDPVGSAAFDDAVSLARKIGQGCGAKYDGTLKLFSTEQTARDMDAIRAAVGDEKMTYLGYSYGTLLGATYAQLFPSHVRALVLDGAVDPTEDAVTASEGQAKGFEKAFANFSDWCAKNASSCPIAPDARRAVTDALDKARVSPVAGTGGREATSGWIFWAVVSALYSKQSWPDLATAIDDLQGGDPSGVFHLADAYAERGPDGHYSNLFDANSAINCADEKSSPSIERIRALQQQWRARYPLFGAPLAVGLLGCTLWPGGHDPYPTGKAAGAPPIMVVGTTGDPATPYEQTAKLADMLGVGRVLTWQGEGHTAYPSTRCITNAVDDYLIKLTVPRAGLVCPAR